MSREQFDAEWARFEEESDRLSRELERPVMAADGDRPLRATLRILWRTLTRYLGLFLAVMSAAGLYLVIRYRAFFADDLNANLVAEAVGVLAGATFTVWVVESVLARQRRHRSHGVRRHVRASLMRVLDGHLMITRSLVGFPREEIVDHTQKQWWVTAFSDHLEVAKNERLSDPENFQDAAAQADREEWVRWIRLTSKHVHELGRLADRAASHLGPDALERLLDFEAKLDRAIDFFRAIPPLLDESELDGLSEVTDDPLALQVERIHKKLFGGIRGVGAGRLFEANECALALASDLLNERVL